MRTRFAPSPTGFLHVGGLRTALYAYLLAKQSKDAFILRIEDTDQERSIPGAIENILHTLHWAGLHPDEGAIVRDGVMAQVGDRGPYIQSERLPLYRKYAEELVDIGAAYYAFDTKEELDQMRDEMTRDGIAAPRYDASVRMRMKNSLTLKKEEVTIRLEKGEPYVIRMKVEPNQLITFEDDIRGKLEFQGKTVDDQVLLKSDGFPTYHLAHVVDDHLMDIQIVIRGEEWLSSLPKHLLLFQYFGWKEPRYAHVPLLLNKDKSKLSKRQGDVAAEDYIKKGYLPEALLNFLALLGWNPGTTQELFSLQDLIDGFSLDRVQKGGAIFDTEKLDWLQGQWIRRFPPAEFAAKILPFVARKYPEANEDKKFDQKAALIQERITFCKEAPEMLSYFYKEPKFDLDLVANKKQKVAKELLPEIIDDQINRLASIPNDEWNVNKIKLILGFYDKTLNHLKLKRGQYLWPLRAILTGLPFSPGAFEVAAALGRETTLKRLEAARKAI
ncbi:MAG: glutamate--tRNA ligase [Candidatus Peribacteraceae bacterium]|nr:glutamate--tRNA ligase [Candidatus Peribacteraceae bacterium]